MNNFTSQQIFWAIYAIILVLFAAVQYELVAFSFLNTSLLYTILLAGVSIVFFISDKEYIPQIRGGNLRTITLFTVSFVIVHFQKYIDFLLGITSTFNRKTPPEAANKAALLSLLGITFLFFGYRSYLLPKKIKLVSTDKYYKLPVFPLAVLSFLILCYLVYSFHDYYLLSQYSPNIDALRSSIEQALKIVFCAIFIIKSRQLSAKKLQITFWSYATSHGILFNCTFFAYLFLVVLSGDRGPIFTLLLAYYFSYIISSKHKVTIVKLAILLCIGAVFISLLGIVRSFNKEADFIDRIKFAITMEEGTLDKSVIPFTSELAGSSKTLEYIVDYFPEKHPFLYGNMALKGLLKSSGIGTIDSRHQKYNSSAAFVTWIEQGDNPNSGAGTTIIADIFIDFGYGGVVIIMFFLGSFLRKLDVFLFCYETYKIPIFYHVLGMTLFMNAIILARASLFANIRIGIFCLVILYTYKRVVKIIIH